MPQLTPMKLDAIKIEGQVRKSFLQQEMDELTASIKAHGVLQPPLVRNDGVLLAGERRVRAAKAAGLKEIPVIVTDKVLSDSEVRLIQLVENVQRSELSDPEVYLACKEISEMNPTWQHKDIADQIGKSASMVTRIMSVGKLVPEALKAFMEGKLRFRGAYSIALLPQEDQPGLLAMHMSGMPAEQIASISREKRKPAKPQDEVKASIVRFPLSTGTTVVVKGAEMSLEGMIEALQLALEGARRASKESLDVKTAQRVWADKAKAAS